MKQEHKPSSRDSANSNAKRAQKSEKGRPAAKASAKDANDEDEDEDEWDDEDEDDEEDDEDDEQPRADNRPNATPPRRTFRLRNWLFLAGALALVGALFLNQESDTETEPGDVVDANITLVTADREDLDCLATDSVKGFQCGFSGEKTQRKVDDQHRLRPYLTLDRELFLIPGLFLEPAIEARYKTEPPDKPRNQLRRFTAKCKVKIEGELDAVRLRWSPGAPWTPKSDNVRVGTVSGCGIEG